MMHSVTSLDKVLQALTHGVTEIEKSLEQFKNAHEFFPFTAKHTKTLLPEDFSVRYQVGP